MKLYVCYGTFPSPLPGGHPCATAHDALTEAGHKPEVVHTWGTRHLPQAVNKALGRGAVIDKTGQKSVPVLELDGGETIYPTNKIVAWARENPARRRGRSAAG